MKDNMTLEWQVVAAWAGAIASWFGATVALLAERRRRRERAAEMDQKYNQLADSREIFWTALREAYSRFRQSHSQAPEHLDDLIRACSVPPDLAPRKGRDLRLWPAENASKLCPDQRMLLAFASLVYPARQGRQGQVSDYSFIAPARAKPFHEA